MSDDDTLVFDAETPLGFRVQLTRGRWELITNIKHPVMLGREIAVKATLERPETVRQSRQDPAVFLFYRLERARRWTCVVVKRTAQVGFVITAYPTNNIKSGDKVWPK